MRDIRGIGFLSAFAGLAFGAIGFLVLKILHIEDALFLSVVSGLLFGAMMYPCLMIYGKIMDRRYKKLEKKIQSPVFYKTVGKFFPLGQKVRIGMVYFCEDGIILASLEEKPYLCDRLPLENVDYITRTTTQLHIVTKEGRRIAVDMSNPEKTAQVLKEKGWL